MQDNELIEILKEKKKKRVEQLNDNARNLFNAIMNIANQRDKLLEEKQELIDYLKEEISMCDERIDFHKKEISGVVNISDNNRHLILIKKNKIKKETYEEILSKIEKSDE